MLEQLLHCFAQLRGIEMTCLCLDPFFFRSQASYGVEDPEYAVTQLAQTTMRSELGKLTLDKVFRVGRTTALPLLVP